MTPDPVVGVRRSVVLVERGWHVQTADGRWRLVERVTADRHGRAMIAFTDDPLGVTYFVGTVTTRTPAEQIAAVPVEEKARAQAWRREFTARQRTRRVWAVALDALTGTTETTVDG